MTRQDFSGIDVRNFQDVANVINLLCAFSCLNRADIIRVYDGKTSTDPAITILCNEGTEMEVLSTGPELFVEFVANSDQPGRGFRASFQFQQSIDNSVGKYQVESFCSNYLCDSWIMLRSAVVSGLYFETFSRLNYNRTRLQSNVLQLYSVENCKKHIEHIDKEIE